MRIARRIRGARAARPGPAARLRSAAPLGALAVACLLASCGGGGDRAGTREGPPASVPAPDAGTRSAPPAGPARTPPASLPPLVADARWVVREGERALVVTPTAYLRSHGEFEVALEAWRRVVAAVPDAASPGMEEQFVCHARFAAAKSGWYLEPRRPAVGYARTVMAGCNPGEVRDVG